MEWSEGGRPSVSGGAPCPVSVKCGGPLALTNCLSSASRKPTGAFWHTHTDGGEGFGKDLCSWLKGRRVHLIFGDG